VPGTSQTYSGSHDAEKKNSIGGKESYRRLKTDRREGRSVKSEKDYAKARKK